MRLAIIGTRGIPARYGGFETFAFHLAGACAARGIDVTVVNEKDNHPGAVLRNVRVMNSKYNKGTNPLKFYRDSLRLVIDTNEIVLVCGVGGALFYPLRPEKTKIVTNVDGLEHLRGKFSFAEQKFVVLSQRFAAKRSDLLVADSPGVSTFWKAKFPFTESKLVTIEYGAEQVLPFKEEHLKKHGLSKGDYYLVIARLVPENNAGLILAAYRKYSGKKKLVIVGDIPDNEFGNELTHSASERIVFTGGIYDKGELDSLRQGCFAYIHGHSVGGTNPSLLEAMAAGCLCLCHDNGFNREVTAGEQLYFDSDLHLTELLNAETDLDPEAYGRLAKARVKDFYSWERICSAYIGLFNSMVDGKG